MKKSELIEKIASQNPNLTAKEVEKIVNVVFEKIVDVLAEGDRVEFRGFGSFSVCTRTPRMAKNPRTGQQVAIEERKIVHFKAGKGLYDMLNK